MPKACAKACLDGYLRPRNVTEAYLMGAHASSGVQPPRFILMANVGKRTDGLSLS